MTYDSSMPAPKNGIYWPEKVDGIWEFYMPQVYSPGFDSMTTAMDYNFWAKFNDGKEEPDTAPELRDIVKKTYDFMYDQAYNGNRAPILIANHFNKWNGDSFNPPAMDFMKEKCGQPDTYCATYQDVIAWMETAGSGGARPAAGPGPGRGDRALTLQTDPSAEVRPTVGRRSPAGVRRILDHGETAPAMCDGGPPSAGSSRAEHCSCGVRAQLSVPRVARSGRGAASARSALALIASRSHTASPGATSLYVLAKRSSGDVHLAEPAVHRVAGSRRRSRSPGGAPRPDPSPRRCPVPRRRSSPPPSRRLRSSPASLISIHCCLLNFAVRGLGLRPGVGVAPALLGLGLVVLAVVRARRSRTSPRGSVGSPW